MEKKYINIDSTQRNNIIYPDSSSFNLDYILTNIESLENVKYISIIDAYIPKSNKYFINYENYNNFIYIKPLLSGLPGKFLPTNYNKNIFLKIIIPNNNYTNNTIVDKLNELLLENNISELNENNISELNESKINGLFFKNNNNIIEIKNNINYIDYIINFSNIDLLDNKNYLTLGYYLGFRKLEYLIKSNSNINGETTINFNLINYIFIKINDYGNIYPNLKKSLNVLSKLIFNNNDNTYILSNNTLLNSFYFKELIHLKHLDIQLIDYSGNIYNTNEDYHFILEIGIENVNNISNKENSEKIDKELIPIIRQNINDIKNSFVLNEDNLSIYENNQNKIKNNNLQNLLLNDSNNNLLNTNLNDSNNNLLNTIPNNLYNLNIIPDNLELINKNLKNINLIPIDNNHINNIIDNKYLATINLQETKVSEKKKKKKNFSFDY